MSGYQLMPYDKSKYAGGRLRFDRPPKPPKKRYPKQWPRRYEGLYTFRYTDSLGSNISSTGGAAFNHTDSLDHGDNQPSWRRAMRLGQGVITSLDGTFTKYPRKFGYLVSRRVRRSDGFWTKHEVSGDLFTIVPQPTPGFHSGVDTVDADNQARTRFIRQASSVQTRFQTLPFLKDLRKTIDSIKHPFRDLQEVTGQYLQRLKRGADSIPFRSIARRKKFLTNAYLEYTYGAQPLASDIRNGAKALADTQIDRFYDINRVSGHGLSSAQGPLYLNAVLGYGNAGISYDVEYLDGCDVTYGGGVRLASDAGSSGILYNLSNVGLDLQNFAPSCWEILPYSFLADYFTNIGSIIQAYSFQTCNLAWCWRTERDTTSYKVTNVREAFQPIQDGWDEVERRFEPGDVPTNAYVSVSRRKYTGSLVPSLAFSIPGLKSMRWANIAALARQADALVPFWSKS